MRYKLLLSVVCFLFLSNILVAQEETINKLDESKKIELENNINEFSKKQTDEIVNKIKQMGEPAFIEIRQKAKSKIKNNLEREISILLIEKLEDTEATEDLMNIVEDESDNRYIRSRAASGLYRVGRKDDLKVFNQLKNIAETEKDENTRRNVIMATGKIGQKEAISYLQGVINGNDTERVKASAIYGLGAIDDESVNAILISGLETDNTSLTLEYIRVLARDKKSKKATQVLLHKLNSLNEKGKKEDNLQGAKKMVIFEALGDLGDQSVVTDLRKFLDSPRILDVLDVGIVLCKLKDLEGFRKALNRAKEAGEYWIVDKLKTTYKNLYHEDFKE